MDTDMSTRAYDPTCWCSCSTSVSTTAPLMGAGSASVSMLTGCALLWRMAQGFDH